MTRSCDFSAFTFYGMSPPSPPAYVSMPCQTAISTGVRCSADTPVAVQQIDSARVIASRGHQSFLLRLVHAIPLERIWRIEVVIKRVAMLPRIHFALRCAYQSPLPKVAHVLRFTSRPLPSSRM